MISQLDIIHAVRYTHFTYAAQPVLASAQKLSQIRISGRLNTRAVIHIKRFM